MSVYREKPRHRQVIEKARRNERKQARIDRYVCKRFRREVREKHDQRTAPDA